ncbi:hypothetical protein SAMN06269185_3195 [Natronoarchaeum philippinense]|uniref:PKD domain-containing protein n=1 Tax=Natronoarchaeum philippinense TaxID=558529 RepID=A0A285P9X7_NATPI|nr:hypothetical protein [Natronoarchaeum philippinense]SNZ18003.1 hypothetical protein SAMN06269185_3195 [Natronoarchaeum philippinense]
MRRRFLLGALSGGTVAGLAGCSDSEPTGIDVLDTELTDVGDGAATMRARVENHGERANVEVAVALAWADGETFETYSDVIGLAAGERRWVDVPIRHYGDAGGEYEHRVSAAVTSRPLARFDYEPATVAVGDLIRFDAGASRVVEGAIAAFDWTIGDAYEVGPEVQYRLGDADAEGVTAELRVTDTQGAFDTARRRVEPVE